jgi:hypothetical protein
VSGTCVSSAGAHRGRGGEGEGRGGGGGVLVRQGLAQGFHTVG